MIRLEKFVMHIIDPTVGAPVISENEHPEDGAIYEFMETHIEKAFLDISNKELDRMGNEELSKSLDNYKEGRLDFIELSKNIAENLYSLFATAELDGFDLVCARFTRHKINYLGLFLFQYKTSYIHNIDYIDDKPVNKIIRQNSALPTENQKLDEFLIFNLDENEILLKEKRYNIDGDRDFILSSYFLKVDQPFSSKDKIDIVNKTSKKIVKDFYNDDVNKLAEINSILVDSVDETGTINIDNVSNRAFTNNFEVQAAYIEEVEKKGLYDKTIEVDEGLSKRLPSFQKIILDDGIEIKIPIEFLNDSNKVEFISNENGSVSIILKNLKDIKNK